MGFYLKCAVAKVEGEDAARVETAMRALFPAFVTVRRFTAPFAGVIAAYDERKLHRALL